MYILTLLNATNANSKCTIRFKLNVIAKPNCSEVNLALDNVVMTSLGLIMGYFKGRHMTPQMNQQVEPDPNLAVN